MNDTVNVVSQLPEFQRRRAGLLRMLRQVERDIEWLERKQAIAERVAADRIASARTDIPTLAQVLAWDGKFREAYRAEHAARNRAILRTTTDGVFDDKQDSFTGNAKEVMDHVEGELAEAESQVTMDVNELSERRGEGYEAAFGLGDINTAKLSVLQCPFAPPTGDYAMAWWGGVYQRLGLL